MRLENKTAIVTGAGRGLGKGIALKLAAEGAKVIVADMSMETASATAEEINASGGTAKAFAVNIAKQDEVLKTLTAVMRREKPETVVVTCKARKSHYDDKGKKVTDEAEQPICVEIPTKVSDVNKAAEMLGKYYALFTDKLNVDGDMDYSIKIDYGGEDE